MTRAHPGLKRDVRPGIERFGGQNPLTHWVSWHFFGYGKLPKIVYRALVSERDVRRSMVRDLIGQLFQGDVKALVSHLVRESEIDATDLNELKKMIAEKEEKAK